MTNGSATVHAVPTTRGTQIARFGVVAILLLVLFVAIVTVAAVIHWRTTRIEVSTELPPLFFGAHRRGDDVAVEAQPGHVLSDQDSHIPADPRDLAESATVRFRRPGDEPIQLLPGRLEVVAGDARQQDIRLVRVAGERPELTVGRDPGTSVHHVTLCSSTVSRRHAKFTFEDGDWVVANLSTTNPVVVNDHELTRDEPGRRLADGDRLEIGEVVLHYHAS
jgi:hypothetical protein